MHTSTAATASPPWRFPTIASARTTSRPATPERSKIRPARAHQGLRAERRAECGYAALARLFRGVLERADARHRAIEREEAFGPGRGGR
jgi:hypothetical protein